MPEEEQEIYADDYGIFPMLESHCLSGDILYFVMNFGNCVCSYNLCSQEFNILGFLPMPQADYRYRPPVGAIGKCGDYLAAAPYSGSYFHLFDLKSGKGKPIPCQIQGLRKYAWALPHDDEVIFIGGRLPSIARLDIANGNVSYDDSFAEEIMAHGTGEENWGRTGCARIVRTQEGKDWLYMVNLNNPWLLEYELGTGFWQLRRIPNVPDDNGFGLLLQEGNCLYLISRNNGIAIKWNLDAQTFHEVQNDCGWMPRGAFISLQNGRIFSLHCQTLAAFRSTVSEEGMEPADLDESIKVREWVNPWLGQRLLWMEPYRGGFIAFFAGEAVFYQLNQDFRIDGKLTVQMQPSDWEKYQEYILDKVINEGPVLENTGKSVLDLKKFLDMVAVCSEDRTGMAGQYFNGQRIYQSVLERLIHEDHS